MIKTVSSKRSILRIITAIFVLANLVYYYFTRKIAIEFIAYTTIPVLVIWLIYGLSLKYLQWNRNTTEKNLKCTSITAEAEIK